MSKRSNPGKTPETGTMGFTELSTTDSTTTRSFLEKSFRWRFREIPMPTGQYLTYQGPDGSTVGIRPAQQSETPSSMNYVRVADLTKAEANIREQGGEIILPRTDIPEMGSFFWFRVPAGPIMACWQDAPKQKRK